MDLNSACEYTQQIIKIETYGKNT